MRVVVLVPWRSDGGVREQVWRLCKRRWRAQFPDWPIYEGASPEGPFNRSAAINDAAEQAGAWDVALIIDADVLLPPENVWQAVARAETTGKVVWAHRRWRSVSQEATERLLGPKGDLYEEPALGHGGVTGSDLMTLDQAGHPILDLIVERTNALSFSCCIAIRRDAWDRIDGFDERFVGWGHEDGAFMAAAVALAGLDRIEGDVLTLWHPRKPGSGQADRDNRNNWTAQALANERLGIRYTYALRRDFRFTDGLLTPDAVVLAKDMENLRTLDADRGSRQSVAERQRFEDWWPSIEEMVADARAYRDRERNGTVTIVVHTGGLPENWPERSAYLRKSLASLEANVTGPIVQRRIYTDWGSAFRPELDDIAAAHGYKVVGPAENLGFTESMRSMWGYLAKNATGLYIFATEDDFLYQPTDLRPMIQALRTDPFLAQVALLRNPYESEKARGGILGHPASTFTRAGMNGTSRLEHRAFWTCNPSLFRRSVTDRPWPQGVHSETLFGKSLLTDKRTRFAFWGSGEEQIEHIGEVRAGVGY